MESIMKQLKDNWIVLGFVASMILWYGNTNSRLTAVEAQQVEQKTTIEKVDILVTDVAVIKEKTTTSDKKIDSLSGKVDYIISNMKR